MAVFHRPTYRRARDGHRSHRTFGTRCLVKHRARQTHHTQLRRIGKEIRTPHRENGTYGQRLLRDSGCRQSAHRHPERHRHAQQDVVRLLGRTKPDADPYVLQRHRQQRSHGAPDARDVHPAERRRYQAFQARDGQEFNLFEQHAARVPCTTSCGTIISVRQLHACGARKRSRIWCPSPVRPVRRSSSSVAVIPASTTASPSSVISPKRTRGTPVSV